MYPYMHPYWYIDNDNYPADILFRWYDNNRYDNLKIETDSTNINIINDKINPDSDTTILFTFTSKTPSFNLKLITEYSGIVKYPITCYDKNDFNVVETLSSNNNLTSDDLLQVTVCNSHDASIDQNRFNMFTANDQNIISVEYYNPWCFKLITDVHQLAINKGITDYDFVLYTYRTATNGGHISIKSNKAIYPCGWVDNTECQVLLSKQDNENLILSSGWANWYGHGIISIQYLKLI